MHAANALAARAGPTEPVETRGLLLAVWVLAAKLERGRDGQRSKTAQLFDNSSIALDKNGMTAGIANQYALPWSTTEVVTQKSFAFRHRIQCRRDTELRARGVATGVNLHAFKGLDTSPARFPSMPQKKRPRMLRGRFYLICSTPLWNGSPERAAFSCPDRPSAVRADGAWRFRTPC